MFTCPNPSCGKVFETPLKTLNLQGPAEPYAACPYCLTEIMNPPAGISKLEDEQESSSSKGKASKNRERPPACHYHLGYLSEREEKQQIPDECIVCNVLLECMLQKMRT
jgi:hypothetical protein